MQYKNVITIIDDFHDAPQCVRRLALDASYQSPASQFSPNKIGPIANRAVVPSEIYKSTINKLHPLIDYDIRDAKFEFRYSTQDTIKRQSCHADNVDYAGIVYLTLPQSCQGGTWFYKHIPTGHFYLHPECYGEYNYRNADEWEKVYEVDMKFNRFVFYPGKLFHAVAIPFFGQTIEDSRLTENIFLKVNGFTMASI